MDEKELEKKLSDLQFQIDLLDTKLNQWIEKIKNLKSATIEDIKDPFKMYLDD